MKKKLTLITILYIFCFSLFADGFLTIGNSNNFNKFELKDLEIVKGERGNDNLVLKSNEYEQNPETDLLIHFNDNDFIDSAGNYLIEDHYNNTNTIEKKFGSSSAFFLLDREITFHSVEDTIFSPGRLLEDFTIEFWVKPIVITEDTTLFSWKGVYRVESDFIPQRIKCYFENRSVVWKFENLFIPTDYSKYTLELKGKTKLIPGKWNHHLLRYDSSTGMLEYLLNGIPEDIKYATKSKKEEFEIFTPYIGDFSKKEIFLGESLRGFMDEFRISESFILEPNLLAFRPTGSFYSPVYDINGEDVVIHNIELTDKIAKETLVNYKYRVSSSPFLKKNESIKWKSLTSLDREQGRYIQIMADFFSNGISSKSPMLEEIKILWNTIPTPPTPLGLKSNPGNGSINLQWNPIKHYNIQGYYLYIGNESNNYKEVIDVGNNTSYTIKNLKSNNIYYFSVRAYLDNKMSEYSEEVYNRPN